MTQVDVLKYLWMVFGIFWLLRARHSARSITREASWWRLGRLAILAGTFALLFARSLPVGPLAVRFLPSLTVLPWFGVAVTSSGLALCVWARLHLGINWSDKVVLKADHELIRTGPYRHFRHPIYSGMLLAIFGTALTIGEWRGLVALTVMAVNYFIKARREEQILTEQFGNAYRSYQQSAGFLLPHF